MDPHLCNNAGLVTRLVVSCLGVEGMRVAQDWEESWEVGARYVQNEWLLSLRGNVNWA